MAALLGERIAAGIEAQGLSSASAGLLGDGTRLLGTSFNRNLFSTRFGRLFGSEIETVASSEGVIQNEIEATPQNIETNDPGFEPGTAGQSGQMTGTYIFESVLCIYKDGILYK